jgi:hypothetical protein
MCDVAYWRENHMRMKSEEEQKTNLQPLKTVLETPHTFFAYSSTNPSCF